MGGSCSEFQSEKGKEKLKEYQKFTYLKSFEIFKCCDEFRIIAGKANESLEDWKINEEKFKNWEKFKNNPFQDRIYEIFSDQNNIMYFDNFLNMMSVFSDSCPTELKAKYAFKIYDFNNSQHLQKDDIANLIKRITSGYDLAENVLNEIIKKIFEEADLDNNGKITFEEFNHIANKYSKDFHK